MKVVLNDYLPLRDVVFNTLRKAILKGEFSPGERLMEKQLADRLGVSRTPVREAIRKLELEGLVVMIPRKGAEVARVTEKDISDVLEVRATLEGLAVKLACKNMTPAELKKLVRINQEFAKAADKSDVEKIIDLDIAFHDTIFKASNNDKLISILNNLREQIYRFRMEYVYHMADYKQLVREHQQIVDAISNNQSDKAQDSAIIHIQNQEKSVIEYSQRQQSNNETL